jgi:hypothetical protein
MHTLIHRWAVRSQQQSRRNAMIALTALTQRRAEQIEVDEFLAELAEPSRSGSAVRAAGGEDAVRVHRWASPAAGGLGHTSAI